MKKAAGTSGYQYPTKKQTQLVWARDKCLPLRLKKIEKRIARFRYFRPPALIDTFSQTLRDLTPQTPPQTSVRSSRSPPSTSRRGFAFLRIRWATSSRFESRRSNSKNLRISCERGEHTSSMDGMENTHEVAQNLQRSAKKRLMVMSH